MQDENGFYSPLQYQPQWFWLGLVMVLLVGLWYAAIFLWGRKKAPARQNAPAHQGPHLERLRSECLQAIDATAEDADAGRLPERDAHQKLSFLVREFAGTAKGLPLTSMTLEELRRHEYNGLAAGIAGIYPSEFAPQPTHTVQESAEAARQVVRAWN
ncbi:hypothetical protein [Paenarthrobacter aurescens]|nr:hypothetical protein [Paenarthrobacter aurescens]MDO6143780.1 hypothetical protein [Paenarthrobacter aurescens]MDO6147627.1 hypothetical protein [Paenarthrobacter aurescens]MDO6158871.1 hypothetical protein [Paenarthrobacter aurescens]MDO6162855.1 hypothetical protein [Paenarthrobacter aurescens]